MRAINLIDQIDSFKIKQDKGLFTFYLEGNNSKDLPIVQQGKYKSAQQSKNQQQIASETHQLSADNFFNLIKNKKELRKNKNSIAKNICLESQNKTLLQNKTKFLSSKNYNNDEFSSLNAKKSVIKLIIEENQKRLQRYLLQRKNEFSFQNQIRDKISNQFTNSQNQIKILQRKKRKNYKMSQVQLLQSQIDFKKVKTEGSEAIKIIQKDFLKYTKFYKDLNFVNKRKHQKKLNQLVNVNELNNQKINDDHSTNFLYESLKQKFSPLKQQFLKNRNILPCLNSSSEYKKLNPQNQKINFKISEKRRYIWPSNSIGKDIEAKRLENLLNSLEQKNSKKEDNQKGNDSIKKMLKGRRSNLFKQRPKILFKSINHTETNQRKASINLISLAHFPKTLNNNRKSKYNTLQTPSNKQKKLEINQQKNELINKLQTQKILLKLIQKVKNRYKTL